ncbi:MAG: hypothetical protein H8E68_02990 [Kiritimatiellaeota bacterium]|nr:hypothetical protein [Kiritimatiellota bacterium]
MKTLCTAGSYSIGILDTNNYVLFDHTKPKRKTRKGIETVEYEYSYYSQLAQAVKELARRTANEQAKDLRDWLKKFNATCDELTGLFTARESLLDLQGYSLVKKPKKRPPPASPPPVSACKCSTPCAVCTCSSFEEINIPLWPDIKVIEGGAK